MNCMIKFVSTLLLAFTIVNSANSQCPSTITDIDGNVYNVVQINNQCWMKENLNTSHYRSGASILTGYSNAQWQGLTTGAFSYYNDDSISNNVYGKLYNWYAVTAADSLCPLGWHVPDETEWNSMLIYLDPALNTNCQVNCVQSAIAGGPLKETGTLNWSSPNTSATNSSGFTALGGGYRFYNGNYQSIKANGAWWSTTPYGASSPYAWNRYLYNNSSIVFLNFDYKQVGVSVRCVSNNAATGLEPGKTKSNFEISPNPFTDYISIKVHESIGKPVIFKIHTALGQTLYSEVEDSVNSTFIKTINLDFLPNGIYLLEMINEGESSVKKIIK